MCNSSNNGSDDKLQATSREAETENEENEVNSVTSKESSLDDGLQIALQKADTENEENEVSFVISKENSSDIESKISAENSRINRELLIPELVANEKQKRDLKKFLLIGVIVFISVQILMMSVFICLLVYSVTIGSNRLTNIDKELCKSLIDFMKFFVSATLCEFIAMLFFIVKYVFDKSIFELIKLFKSDDINLNNETQNTVNPNLNFNDEDNSKSA